MNRRSLTIVLGVLVTLVIASAGVQAQNLSGSGLDLVPGKGPQGATEAEQRVSDAYARLPLSFVENRGQTDERVHYLAQSGRYGFFFTSESVVISLLEASEQHGVNLSLDFVYPNPNVTVDAVDKTHGTVNYLKGDNLSERRTGLSRFREVVYRELWPGVDMAIRDQDGVLKYEFRVQPGARIGDIRLAYRGADGLALDRSGGLVVDTAVGPLHDSAPVSYQMIDGRRVPVESHYLLDTTEQSYRFEVGVYDASRELIIDPGLGYSTYLGGSASQAPSAIAVDDNGNAYVTGYTQSPDFPTTPGAFDRNGSFRNGLDAFVAKLNPTGTGLVYSTFLGGSDFEWGNDLAIDENGNAYVTGRTQSFNFPVTGDAFQDELSVRGECPRCGIGAEDAFVSKLNSSGSDLVYSTYLGGAGFDDGMSIAVDESGRAYVGGQTGSDNFPTRSGSFDTTHNGVWDVFVTKFNPSGSGLVYSTFLGGSDIEDADDIEVDASGAAVVVGSVSSVDFPTTPGTIMPTHGSDRWDGYAAKLNPSGSDLVYSTFIGGSGNDSVYNVELDTYGNAYLVGHTSSPEFPTTPGTFDPVFDGSESYIAKMDPSGSEFLYSTFFGKAGASAMALESDGSVWLVGGAAADAFITPEAWDPQRSSEGSDIYLAHLDSSGSSLDYATFFGGAGLDGARSVALDPDGNVYFTGITRSENFPTTEGALDDEYSANSLFAGYDGFVAMFEVGPDAPEPPAPPPPIPEEAPQLLNPEEFAIVAPPATFDWSDVEGAATYEIQLDGSETFFPRLIVDEESSVSEFTVNELPAGDWTGYWRVRALNSEGTPGPWSEVGTLNKWDGAPPPVPDAPSPISPADGAQVTTLPIIFEWTRVEGADHYIVEFDNEPTFSAPLLSDHFVVGSKSLIYLADGKVFWRIRAFNAAGVPGPYSEVRSLQVETSTPTTTTTVPPTTTTTVPTTTTTTTTTTTLPPTTTTTVQPTTTTTTTTLPPTTTTLPSGPLPAPSMNSPRDDAEFEPGSTITFDWDEVSGAASYTIQIDDDDDFPSPHTVEETVIVTQFTKSGLPEQRFWWRVRANDANGNPGRWSRDRRFELED